MRLGIFSNFLRLFQLFKQIQKYSEHFQQNIIQAINPNFSVFVFQFKAYDWKQGQKKRIPSVGHPAFKNIYAINASVSIQQIGKIQKIQEISSMEQVQQLRDIIPDFILKLYHILEKQQFEECIAWGANGEQVHIKNAKKLEDRVLPHFFRHKHVTSFIRQLNMYKFSKVNKITRERGHMYFRNNYFMKGDIQKLKMIKRTQRHKKANKSPQEQKSSEILPKETSPTSEAFSQKCPYPAILSQICFSLQRISQKYPRVAEQIAPVINLCKKSVIKSQSSNLYESPSISDLLAYNMMPSEKDVLKVHEQEINMDGILPSICSLSHLE